MASWFAKGRPALYEALEKICTEIDANITADLESLKSTEELAKCTVLLQQSSAKINALENENATLRAQIEKLRHKSANGGKNHPLEHLPPTGSSMPNGILEASDPETAQKLEFAKLAQRFRILNENFTKARSALERRKTERDAWKRRFETLQEQVHAAESERDLGISNRASAALAALPPVATSFGRSFTSISDPNDAGPDHGEPELPPIRSKSPISSCSGGPTFVPLESTQDGSEEDNPASLPTTTEAPSDPAVKQEPSSDGPFLVFERPVKKRRSDQKRAEPSQAVRVKIEPQDSSPVEGETRVACSQESIDLGHITHITTPRKPREAGAGPATISFSRIPGTNANASATPMAKYVMHDVQIPQAARASLMSSALTPISVNRRMIRSGGDKPNKPSRKRQLGSGIADIADDGTFSGTGHEITPIKSVQSAQTPRSRLGQLLHEPQADESVSLSRLPRLGRNGSTISTADLDIPDRRELPFDKQMRQNKSTLPPVATVQPSPLPPHKSSQLRTRPEGSRLRNKPPGELRLDDFRINPAANEGHGFAYSDVVRDKDDRACLPGCMEMHCCGKQFRALAISQRPDPPLTPAQRLEEQRLLEQYLGDCAYRIATMDPKERSETWIEAKAQELASKYGKHRHRYSRMQSPPGFWNADFPSTQELEADQAEAAERERRAIRERYREAMRPEGRWLFKDE